MTGPTLELPIMEASRRVRRLPEPPLDRAEAVVEGVCLVFVAVFVVALFAYGVATAFGWKP